MPVRPGADPAGSGAVHMSRVGSTDATTRDRVSGGFMTAPAIRGIGEGGQMTHGGTPTSERRIRSGPSRTRCIVAETGRVSGERIPSAKRTSSGPHPSDVEEAADGTGGAAAA